MRIAVSHPVCTAVLRDRRFGRIWFDAEPPEEFEAFNRLHRPNMLSNESEHDRLRAALSGLFGRGRIKRFRRMVHEIADRLVSELHERIAEQGHADFMRHVAGPLPVEVIGELLAVPGEDRYPLRDWSNQIVKMYEPSPDHAARSAAEDAAGEFDAYVRALIEFRRRNPGEDWLSTIVAAIDHGASALTTEELVANYILLVMAGHEASVNGLGNAVAALHDHPDQWRALGADQAELDTAADELLRYDTPNQLFERTATEPVDLAGNRIEPGEKIAVLLGAANRDPAVFTAPDRLDLARSPNHHLALGAGAHYCLGAPLARMEMAVTLAVLAARMPGFELTETPPRRPEFAIRGFNTLFLSSGGS